MGGRVSNRRSVRWVAVLGAAATTATMAPGVALGAEAVDPLPVVPVVEELEGPRGISTDTSRRLFYSEADGSVSQTIRRGVNAGTEVLVTIPEAAGFAPAISQDGKRKVNILTGAGEPGVPVGSLYRWTRKSGEAKEIVNIAEYQATDLDPYDTEGVPEDSNPYGVETLDDGSVLVADAAGNDLLRVDKHGNVETVAMIMPRVVEVPDIYEDNPDFPPPGTPIPAESVPTSVTVGADGYYYVGELRGFPATPGTSGIWRIAPDAVGAVCDPENPDTGDCTLFADGFTSIQDLAPAPDGELYVLELVKASWLAWEAGLDPGVGGLFVTKDGGPGRELADDQLTTPGGVDTTKDGKVFVAGPVFGPGEVARVRTGNR